jgi:peptide/nickel transport system permease protein
MLGGRVSMSVGVVAVLIAITVGTLIGAIAGFFGGRVDSVLMRITDLFLALPVLPFLLMVTYLFRDPLKKVLGPEFGIFILIVGVIGALNWMPLARLVRASFLSVKQKEFVEAARCLGASDRRLMLGHILPNTLSAVIVAATVGVGSAIITESALSFLGVGFPPDMPTWGRLLYDAQNYLDLAPHWAIFPGLLIFLAVLSINYIGDGLRDALDPRKTQ